MYFGCMYRTIFKANCCKSLHLSPTASSKSLAQPRNVSNGATSCNSFNIGDLPDYFKIHRVLIKSFSAQKLKQPSNDSHQRGRERHWPLMRDSLRGLRCMRLLDVLPSSNDTHCEYHFEFDCCNRLLAHFSKFLVQSSLIEYP
jgi:hypothetical protein